LLVALGMLVGNPLVSSWVAAALMVASVTWMLAGVLPKRWALAGGILLALSPFVQLVWSQSLLHGFLPASGSALLLGGLLRLRRRVEFASAFASGCGVGLLAISRPFEGLCCTVICAAMLWFAWKKCNLRERWQRVLRTCLLAAGPVLAAIALTAAHNQSVTGKWWQMPYQLHESQYGVAPLFVFSSPKLGNMAKRADFPEVFYEYHAVDSLNWYRQRVGMRGWLRGVNDASRELMRLTFPFVGMLVFSGVAWCRYSLTRNMALAVALQVSASACVCWVYSHYLAPILPGLLLLCLLALRTSLRTRTGDREKFFGFVVAAVCLIQVAVLGTFAAVVRSNEAEYWSHHRQEIVGQLSRVDGKHMVLVRYTAKHNVHQEWVYNLADPGASKIVWARYDEGRWIDALLDAYPDRQVWVIDADDPKPSLRSFPEHLQQHSSDASSHQARDRATDHGS
ncbi:MAG: hypothetical protein SFV81_14820, partial [Pirellulaceae bacterium]|nr:hypothetical protein [Pirellulaceae bacterium]